MLADVAGGNSVAANTTVMWTLVPGYLCPSDANPGSTESLDVGYGVRVTCVNYAVNGGTNRTYFGGVVNGFTWWLGGNPSYGSRVGFTGSRRNQQYGGVQRMGQGEGRPEHFGAEPRLSGFPALVSAGPQQDISACQAASTPLWDFKGEYWTLQDTGRGGPYYHIMPPNKPSCNVSAGYGVIDSFISGTARFIPAASNILLMDG